MAEHRINPDTGVIEETGDFIDTLGGNDWVPSENENGNSERINPETGVHEESGSFIDTLQGNDYVPKDDGK